MNDNTEPNWRADNLDKDENNEILERDPIRYLVVDATAKTVTERCWPLSLDGVCAELGCSDVRMRRLNSDDWLWFGDLPPSCGTPPDVFGIDGSVITSDYAVITGPEGADGLLTDHRYVRDALLQRIRWFSSTEIARGITTLYTDPTGVAYEVDAVFCPQA